MYFHWQNLNEKPGDRFGWGLLHGRCWWHIGEHGVINPEWVLGRFRFGVSLRTDDEGVHIHFSLPVLGSLYLSLEGFLLIGRLQPKEYQETTYAALAPGYWRSKDRKFLFEVNDWTIRFKPWGPSMEWRSKDPWWVSGVHLNIPDFLFGHCKYSDRTMSTTPVVIGMPEKAYAGTVKMFESTWQRARWPWPRRMVRAEVDVPGGVPFPGKGENSWDCGEDATYSMTCPAKTVEEAIAAMVESTLRDRRRHGGSVNWRPAEVR